MHLQYKEIKFENIVWCEKSHTLLYTSLGLEAPHMKLPPLYLFTTGSNAYRCRVRVSKFCKLFAKTDFASLSGRNISEFYKFKHETLSLCIGIPFFSYTAVGGLHRWWAEVTVIVGWGRQQLGRLHYVCPTISLTAKCGHKIIADKRN